MKPFALLVIATLIEFYIYEHTSFEYTSLQPLALIYPVSIGIISPFIHPDVIIAIGMMYMLVCLTILHLPYWEYLFLHPFIWSVIHVSGHVSPSQYLPLLTIRHVAYGLQYLTPRKIHWQVSIALSGSVYLTYDRLYKGIEDTFKTPVDVLTILLHIITNVCYMLLWKPLSIEKVQAIDAVYTIVLIAVYRTRLLPLYMRSFVNAGAYLFTYFVHAPYTVSINQCVTLAIKEELYANIRVHQSIRYMEHAIGFAIGYASMFYDVHQYIRFAAVGVLCGTQCGLYTYNKRIVNCRCTN